MKRITSIEDIEDSVGTDTSHKGKYTTILSLHGIMVSQPITHYFMLRSEVGLNSSSVLSLSNQNLPSSNPIILMNFSHDIASN